MNVVLAQMTITANWDFGNQVRDTLRRQMWALAWTHGWWQVWDPMQRQLWGRVRVQVRDHVSYDLEEIYND